VDSVASAFELAGDASRSCKVLLDFGGGGSRWAGEMHAGRWGLRGEGVPV